MGTTRKLLLAAISASFALVLPVAPAFAAPPANDDIANATVLAGDRGSIDVDLTEATAESGEPAASGTDDLTIWFSYTPSRSGFASFSICRRDNSLAITGATVGVYSEDPGPAPAAPATDGCPSGAVNAAVTNHAVVAGTTYKIQVGAAAATEILGGTLTYDFNTSAPANDDFADAQDITGALPQTIDADNGLATREADEPGLEDWGPNNSLWYRWTPEADGVVSIDTCQTSPSGTGTAPDSRVGVFTSESAPAELTGLSLTATGDDGCPQPNALLTQKYVLVSAGTEYWIRLSNYSDEFGSPFKLRLKWVGAPETAGPPYVTPSEAPAYVGQVFNAGSYEWSANPAVTEVTVAWLRCNAAGTSCQVIPGETGTSYVGQATDVGSRLAIRVSATNGVDTTTLDSDPTAVIEAVPPEGPGDGGGTPPPSPPISTDPFPALVVAKSLGKVKLSKKSTITVSKLVLNCGPAATGTCTGTFKIATPRTKLKGKVIKPIKLSFPLLAAPGGSAGTTFKVGPGVAKAIKVAKSLKAKATITFGAPGWPAKSASSTLTLTR